MLKLCFIKLLCLTFCFAACTSSNSPQENSHRSLFENCRIIIECPNYSSYYSIDLKNNGEVTLGFCYEKNDTINFNVGQQDSIRNLIVFQISEDDRRHIDSLLGTIPSMNKRDKPFGHDSFRYLLVLDGIIRIEDDTSNKEIQNILKILLSYFPKNIESYDFFGFFRVFNNV